MRCDRFADEVMLNRRLVARNTSVPTNYSVVYKYIRSDLAGLITYIEFDVNGVSEFRANYNASSGQLTALLFRRRLATWH